MEKDKLKLFGTAWCTKSANLRNYLQSEWIEFNDFDVEEDKNAEKEVRDLYNGELKFPTMKYKDEFLKNPSIPEVISFLEKHKLRD